MLYVSGLAPAIGNNQQAFRRMPLPSAHLHLVPLPSDPWSDGSQTEKPVECIGDSPADVLPDTGVKRRSYRLHQSFSMRFHQDQAQMRPLWFNTNTANKYSAQEEFTSAKIRPYKEWKGGG